MGNLMIPDWLTNSLTNWTWLYALHYFLKLSLNTKLVNIAEVFFIVLFHLFFDVSDGELRIVDVGVYFKQPVDMLFDGLAVSFRVGAWLFILFGLSGQLLLYLWYSFGFYLQLSLNLFHFMFVLWLFCVIIFLYSLYLLCVSTFIPLAYRSYFYSFCSFSVFCSGLVC